MTTNGDERPRKPRPLALDANAQSANPDLPAFLARPEGAPVYHGFPILEDVEVDDFRLGMITDFHSSPENGDAFVVAPDGSRAGLVWCVGHAAALEEVCPLEANRWGVWAVAFPEPMTSGEAIRRNLETVLPALKEKWLLWKQRYP
ncbi:MAG: hypothetical protein ACLQLG_05750 [Thermoguttaceae bacterium]